MRRIICLLVFGVLINSFTLAQKRSFLRFYDIHGHKIAKGYFIGATDSSFVVSRDSSRLEIPVSRVFAVKKRRSLGHHIFLSFLIESVPLSIYGASTGEPHVNNNTIGGILHDGTTFTRGEAAILGVIGGMVTGTITGILISGHHKTFTIDGDMRKWEQFSSKIIRKDNKASSQNIPTKK